MRQIFRTAQAPLPIEKVDKQWIKWGSDNLYPQYLVGLYYDNPVHGGIVNQKVKFITAGGLEYNKPNTGVFTYEELITQVSQDFEIFNGWAVKYVKSVVTNEWFAKPIDFELLRPSEDGFFMNYSEDWSKSNQGEKENYKQYKSIHHVSEEDNECIMYVIQQPKQRKFNNQRNLTSNYFPVPLYGGAITSIMAGIEIDRFTHAETVNGFKGGTVITLVNGIPETIQEENKIVNRLKDDATDIENQGGPVVLFANDKESAPQINQLNGNDLDKRYIDSDKNITRKIMIAHSVISPALFSVMSESMFGSKDEMEIAYILFQNNYIKSRQDNISEGINWAELKLNGNDLNLTFKPYTLQLTQNIEGANAVSEALNTMSPLVANKVLGSLTPNEIRSLARLAPLEGGDVLPTVAKAFSAEDRILSEFEKIGVHRGECNITYSQDYEDFADNDQAFKDAYVNSKFASKLTDEDKLILNMIKNGESYDSINKAVGKGGVALSKKLIKLDSEGYIKDMKITDKGASAGIDTLNIKVLYSYEKRFDAPDLIGKSRAFCAKLIELDKLYTRQEIDNITQVVDRDVWTYRGGWYHNPDTEKNTPSCRHVWKQNIVEA